MKSDLAALTYNNYSYKVRAECFLKFFNAVARPLTVGDILWLSHEDGGDTFFFAEDGVVGRLYGLVQDLEGTYIEMTEDWVDPLNNGKLGSVTHGDALDRLGA